MRRFLTLVFLLCLAIPAGISISGCTRNPAGNYCNGLGYGLNDTPGCLHHACSRRSPASRWPSGRPRRLSRPRPSPARAPRLQSAPTATPTAPPTISWSTFRPPATSAPAPGTATPAAASPTTPSATSQSAALNQRPALRHCLHHGLSRFGHLEPGGGLSSMRPVTSITLRRARSNAMSQGTIAQLDAAGLLRANGKQYPVLRRSTISNYACPAASPASPRSRLRTPSAP